MLLAAKCLANNAEVASHLSQNRILHDYMKTDEEGLTERLTSFNLEDDNEFDERYAKFVEECHDINTKMSRLSGNKRIVRMLVVMLSLGRRFRSMSQFSVAYLNNRFYGVHGGVSLRI